MRSFLAGLVAVLVVGCDHPPTVETREWKVSDHGGEQKNANQGRQVKNAGNGIEGVVDLTWQNKCAACHGAGMHGDGPSGALVKAPDLTRADLQDRLKDEDIVRTIRAGKNLMPKFDDLSDDVVVGLVKKIRGARGK